MSVDRLNLIPGELLEQRKARTTNLILIAVAIVLGISVFLVNMTLASQVAFEQRKLDQLNEEQRRLEATIATFKSFKDEAAEFEKQEQLVTTVKSNEVRWSEVLDDISLIIPEGVQLDTFNGDGATAPASCTLSGRADRFEDVAAFIVRLQNSGRFSAVNLTGTTMTLSTPSATSDAATTIDTVTFNISVSLGAPAGTVTPAPAGG